MAGLAILGIFVSDWTVAQKAGAVVGVLVSSVGAAHIDYLVGLVFSYRARIRFTEDRLSYLQAQVALALPFRPVLVVGFRQDQSGFVLILAPQERAATRPAEHLVVVDALARGRVIARAVTSQFTGRQLDEARIVDIEDDFKKVLTERVQTYNRTLPQQLVVLRQDEIERLLTTLGGPQWRSG